MERSVIKKRERRHRRNSALEGPPALSTAAETPSAGSAGGDRGGGEGGIRNGVDGGTEEARGGKHGHLGVHWKPGPGGEVAVEDLGKTSSPSAFGADDGDAVPKRTETVRHAGRLRFWRDEQHESQTITPTDSEGQSTFSGGGGSARTETKKAEKRMGYFLAAGRGPGRSAPANDGEGNPTGRRAGESLSGSRGSFLPFRSAPNEMTKSPSHDTSLTRERSTDKVVTFVAEDELGVPSQSRPDLNMFKEMDEDSPFELDEESFSGFPGEDLKSVRLVGILADPFGEKEEWGDDFEFEPQRRPFSTGTPVDQTSVHEDEDEDRDQWTAGKAVKPSDLASCKQLLKFLADRRDDVDQGLAWFASGLESNEVVEHLHEQLSLIYDEDLERSRENASQVLDWKLLHSELKENYFDLSVNYLKMARLIREEGRIQDASHALQQSLVAFQDGRERCTNGSIGVKWVQLELELRAEAGSVQMELQNGTRAKELFVEAIQMVAKCGSFKFQLGWKIQSVNHDMAVAEIMDGQMIKAADLFANYVTESLEWLRDTFAKLELTNETVENKFNEVMRQSPPSFVPDLLVEALLFVTDCFVSFDEHEQGLACSTYAAEMACQFKLPGLQAKAEALAKDIHDLLITRALQKERMDDEEEDWDEQIATELKVKITRCSELDANPFLSNGSKNPSTGDTWAGDRRDVSSRLIETEAKRFVAWLFSFAEGNQKIQLFPPPTAPFYAEKARNAYQLESWVQNFVRDQARKVIKELRNPSYLFGTAQAREPNGPSLESAADPSASAERSLAARQVDPMQYYQAVVPYVDAFSSDWAYIHMETCWRMLRAEGNLFSTQKQKVRLLLREYFAELRGFMQRIPIFDETERRKRFIIFWYNLRICGMARRLLTPDGMEARGYHQILENTLQSIPQDPNGGDECAVLAAKLAVELCTIDTYAHYGQRAMTPPRWVASHADASGPYPDLVQAYVNVSMKAGNVWRLWKAKTRKNFACGVVVEELEPRVVYAHALVSLYLVCAGVSPLDVSNLQPSEALESAGDRIDIYAVNLELRKLYPRLPSASLTKARMSFAMAHHAAHYTYEHSLSERFMYDSLALLHSYNATVSMELPDSVVTDPFTENALKRYGEILLHNAKYKYAIAAFGAAMDARVLREPENRLSFSRAADVVAVALQKDDWRHALRLLYPLREQLHPKDGNRNEFARYCLMLSSICSDAGCFAAAMEPLRACTMLVVEEHFLNQSKLKFLNEIRRSKHGVVIRGATYLASMIKPKMYDDVSAFQNKLNTERFQLEILRAKLFLDRGDFNDADKCLTDLLAKQIPPGRRSEVLELFARLKLKRGEISRCLELLSEVESLARERKGLRRSRTFVDSNETDGSHEENADGRRKGGNNAQSSGSSAENAEIYPELFLMRTNALLHGKRLDEALQYIDDVIPLCIESHLRLKGQLLYLRGKILYQLMVYRIPDANRLIAAGLEDLEVARDILSRVEDEVLVAKSDLLWVKMSLEWLLFSVEVREVSLETAKVLVDNRVVDPEAIDKILMNLIAFFMKVNLPIQLLDALLCLGELRYLQSRTARVWAPWLKLSWDLFVHLFLDKHSMCVVTAKISSVPFLLGLHSLLERMVRLTMFDDRGLEVQTHVRIFEAFLTTQSSINQRMNLTTTEPAPDPSKNEAGKKQPDDSVSETSTQGAFMHMLSDSGVDIGRHGYRLLVENAYRTVRGTGHVLFMAGLPELYLRLNTDGEAANEEIALGIAAVKVLNDERNYLGQLMKHVHKHRDNITQLFEPNATDEQKILSSYHQMKVNKMKYCRGEISIDELGSRNASTLRAWMRARPRGGLSGWKIPDHIWRQLTYVLHARGLVGYYAVEAGKCMRRFPFAGYEAAPNRAPKTPSTAKCKNAAPISPRAPTQKEYQYMVDLVMRTEFCSSWEDDAERKVLKGLAEKVFCIPHFLFKANPCDFISKGRPAILLPSHTLQFVPWELFFDHLVVRALCTMDVVRGLQVWGRTETPPRSSSHANLLKYISFYTDSAQGTYEQAEAARRKLLSFQVLLRLGHIPPDRLSRELGTGWFHGFAEPRAVNAIARPSGPFNTPLADPKPQMFGLSQSFRLHFSYPHISFVRVPWLGSATKESLKEATERQHEASFYIFLFTHADLVESSDAVFGLFRQIGNCILLFTPASCMHVLARHLIDWEVDRSWLLRSQGNKGLHGTLKLLLQNISSFARERHIPIVQFVGENCIGPILKEFAKEGGVIPKFA